MITLNQLIAKNRQQRRKKVFKPILAGRPQRRALCKRLYIMKPKKPNSARRRVAKLILYKSLKGFIGYIPGNVHTLQEFANVLIRGGRVRDLPGVRYKIIRGTLDCQSLAFRRTGRSKYGTKWWWRVKLVDPKSVRYLKKLEKFKIKQNRRFFYSYIKYYERYKIKYIVQDNLKFNLDLIKKKAIFNYTLNKKNKISLFF